MKPNLISVRLEIVAEKDNLDVTVTGVLRGAGESEIPYTRHSSMLRTEQNNVVISSLFHWLNLQNWLRTQGISSSAVVNLVVSPLTASILTVAMNPEISKLSLELKTYGNSITTSTVLLTSEQKERWTNLSDLEVLQQVQNAGEYYPNLKPLK